MTRRASCRMAGLVGLVVTSGCALLSKSDPITPRYFTPEPVAATHADPVADSGLELRFGRVSAGASIRDRMAYRDSTYEVGYYDERLWTDKPEAYVKRALAHALFDRRGVRQILSGIGSTLDVNVVAFEEIRQPAHLGRVELAYEVYDDRVVRLSRSVVVDRPIAEAKGDAQANAVVQALAEAMSAAVDAVADSTVGELHAESAAARTTP
jgi:cholesterol transport system auxiliary component